MNVGLTLFDPSVTAIRKYLALPEGRIGFQSINKKCASVERIGATRRRRSDKDDAFFGAEHTHAMNDGNGGKVKTLVRFLSQII